LDCIPDPIVEIGENVHSALPVRRCRGRAGIGRPPIRIWPRPYPKSGVWSNRRRCSLTA
jgi:hypothetical protein